uniref:Ring finger protein 122 n=1 Tax=Astyanax mexicanus TaxID=7994 RepID=A0A3B1IZZ4_ASTMX
MKPTCTMPPVTFQDLPLNIYMVIFGTGIFVFVLSLIFCSSNMFSLMKYNFYDYYNLFICDCILLYVSLGLCIFGSVCVSPQQTCAVCLEDFKVKDELGVLPCQHAFHRRCVVKWLEVRCVCPMCNKALSGAAEQHQSIGTLLDELV